MKASIAGSAAFCIVLLSSFSICIVDPDHTLTSGQDFVKMSSGESNGKANFSNSGDSGIAVSGEPAFLGDSLNAAVLVSNSGNSSGSVDLNLEHVSSGQFFSGEKTHISPGSTREIRANFSPVEKGQNFFRWWVSSDGGNISSTLFGEFSIEAYDSQDIFLSLEYHEWSDELVLEVSVSVILSPGKSRNIDLILSKEHGGAISQLQSISVNLDPGKRDLNFELGNPQLDSIHIEAVPIGWAHSSNSTNSSFMPVELPSLDPSMLSVEATFSPEMPTFGERVVAKISLSNSNNFQADAGKVRVILSSDKTILAESSVQSVNAGSTVTSDVALQSWPGGDRIELEVQWSTGEVTSKKFFSINSQVEDPLIDVPFDIVSAGFGILVGSMSIMVGTLIWRAVSTRTPTTSDEGLRETKERSESQSRKEKSEISCTHCDQRLMVPLGHVGGVRCPSCAMEFKVGLAEDSKVVVRSKEDILNCPECDQALRVPIEKRPVMSRCPVCKIEFMAESELM